MRRRGLGQSVRELCSALHTLQGVSGQLRGQAGLDHRQQRSAQLLRREGDTAAETEVRRNTWVVLGFQFYDAVRRWRRIWPDVGITMNKHCTMPHVVVFSTINYYYWAPYDIFSRRALKPQCNHQHQTICS